MVLYVIYSVYPNILLGPGMSQTPNNVGNVARIKK